MLAERLRDFDAGFGQFGFQQLLEHRHAGTALRAGPGAALEFAEFLDRGAALARTAAVDGVADVAGADVVARAQGGVVREFGFRGVPAAGGGEVGAGLGGKFAAEHGPQGRVRGGVADEDAAEERPGVVGGDDFLVDAAGGVGVDDFEGVFGPGEGVAEAGDVDAGELEFGGGVEAGEGGLAAVQPVRDDLGHGVGGCDEAQAHAAVVGDFADGPDAGNLGFAAVGDDDAAAGSELEMLLFAVRGAEQLVPGPDADGDDHEVGVDGAAVRHEDAGDLAVVVGEDFGGEHAAVHGEALGLDQAPERLARPLVQLGVHEPR